MAAFEHWTVGDIHPNVGSGSVTSAALNTDIGALSAAKDAVKIIPVKAVFESVIGILALIRVSVLAPPLSCAYLSITQLGRAGGRRCVRGTSQVLR